jgi:hypothetical protein
VALVVQAVIENVLDPNKQERNTAEDILCTSDMLLKKEFEKEQAPKEKIDETEKTDEKESKKEDTTTEKPGEPPLKKVFESFYIELRLRIKGLLFRSQDLLCKEDPRLCHSKQLIRRRGLLTDFSIRSFMLLLD